MARRRSRSEFDGLREIFDFVPFWVGPLIAAGMYALVRYGGQKLFNASSDPHGINKLIAPTFLPLIAWTLALAIFAIWIRIEFEKFFRRRQFNRTRNAADISKLTWQEFEQLIVELFRRRGYHVEHTGNTCGDGGIDLNLYANGQRTVVQCKHWRTRQVGVQPVRELLGVVTHCRAAAGIVVTSGRFTTEAKQFAGSSPQLQLIDGRALLDMRNGR